MEVKLKLWMKNIVNNERWLYSHSKIEVCCRCPLFGSLIMTHLHSFNLCHAYSYVLIIRFWLQQLL